MDASYPSSRTLLVVWLFMMGSTVGLMWAGRIGTSTTLGIGLTTALFAMAGIKVALILGYYLNLRQSSAGWKKGFGAFIIVLLAIFLGVYALIGSVGI